MTRRRARLTELFLPALSIVGFIALWQAVVVLRGIPPIYLPAPSAIARALAGMAIDGSLWTNLGVTLLRIFAGFIVAAVCGISVGLLMGMSRILAQIADPWLAALYPLPKISLIPLLIIWLGTGEAYNIVISAISAFFPIVLSTYAGVQQVDRGLIQAARDLGANRRQIQLKVVLPAAIPHIFNGLHLGMGVAIILVIAAEMIGGSSQTGMVFLKLQRFIDRKAAPWAVVTGHQPS
jgi:ABC-type nitrate/sulfonate/bicarbonate transport system permease component